jgi:hypothetical protein
MIPSPRSTRERVLLDLRLKAGCPQAVLQARERRFVQSPWVQQIAFLNVMNSATAEINDGVLGSPTLKLQVAPTALRQNVSGQIVLVKALHHDHKSCGFRIVGTCR